MDPTKKPRITVFDFDGTLTKEDTFIGFALYALGWGNFVLALLRSIPWLLKWKLHLIEGGDAKQRLFSFLYLGRKKEDIMAKSHGFVPQFRPEVLNELKRRKDVGDRVMILSASTDLWLEKIAEDLGVELICTGTEVDTEGTLTGRFSTPNCHGAEKVRRLREYLGALDGYYISVYGDEPEGGDRELSEIADERVIV